MDNRVILKKTEQINRCILRIREDYEGHETDFLTNFMRQDAVVLNLQRACECAISLANHVVKEEKLGVPNTSRESFQRLESRQIITPDLAGRMQRMVTFRNLIIHNYDLIQVGPLLEILEKHLDDFDEFTGAILRFEAR